MGGDEKMKRNVSPADVVKDRIKARGGIRKLKKEISSKELSTITAVLNGGKIDRVEAWHLFTAFGETMQYWLNLQAEYDSRNDTEQHVTGSIGAIPQGIAASDSIEWDGGHVVVKRRGAI